MHTTGIRIFSDVIPNRYSHTCNPGQAFTYSFDINHLVKLDSAFIYHTVLLPWTKKILKTILWRWERIVGIEVCRLVRGSAKLMFIILMYLFIYFANVGISAGIISECCWMNNKYCRYIIWNKSLNSYLIMFQEQELYKSMHLLLLVELCCAVIVQSNVVFFCVKKKS